MSVDENLDIDQLIKNYKHSRSRTMLLVTGVMLVILGALGSFFMIQNTNAKLNSTTQSAVQMAELSHKSGYCETSLEYACQKAKEILQDPARAHSEGSETSNPTPDSEIDVPNPKDVVVDYFKRDPVPQIMSLFMSAAMIMRVQLNTTSVLRRKTWN